MLRFASGGIARFTRNQASFIGTRAASTVGGTLEESVERFPHKEAFRSIKQDVRWSYKELNGVVQEIANGFHSLDLLPGDVLAVWLPNNAENFVTQLAAAKAGLTVAVIDPKISTAEEVEYILKDSKASGLLYEPKIAGRNHSEIIQQLLPELATYEKRQEIFRPKNFRHLYRVLSTGFDYEDGVIPFRQIFVNAPEAHVVEKTKKAINEKTPLAVTYTKVDGQQPKKGDVWTHADVLKRARDLSKGLTLTVEDKICLTSEEPGFPFAPVAAIEKNAMVIIPSVEYDQEAVQYALKIESPSIMGTGADKYKRL